MILFIAKPCVNPIDTNGFTFLGGFQSENVWEPIIDNRAEQLG